MISVCPNILKTACVWCREFGYTQKMVRKAGLEPAWTMPGKPSYSAILRLPFSPLALADYITISYKTGYRISIALNYIQLGMGIALVLVIRAGGGL